MSPTITFIKEPKKATDSAIIGIYKDKKLNAPAKNFDKQTREFIENALKANKKFASKSGETLIITLPEAANFARIILLGLGDEAKINALGAETAGGKLTPILKSTGTVHAALFVTKTKKLTADTLAAHIAHGVKLRSYSFDLYKTKKKSANDIPLKSLAAILSDSAKAAKTYKTLSHVSDGTFLARDLVNLPPNDLYPESFAKILKEELVPLGVKIEILDEKKMLKLGMGAIMAVGQGSARQPRMVIMRWNGAKSTKEKPLAFVGKGVTFDTGGISIKPSAGMDDMKMDMGGAAAVSGLMKALATRKAKTNVVGIVGLAENMPSSNAYRPADIIKSLSGKTIEVLNTDAEGRLVLADALTHVQKKFKPKLIIDLATLTGAMMVALGQEYCGTFANDDGLWKELEGASENSGEKLWRMPLDDTWKKDVESKIADLQNIGKSRFAGACTAAGFLNHFIEGDTPWAHMDIAGVAWTKTDKPTVPGFGTGFGVRVLDHFIAQNHEK